VDFVTSQLDALREARLQVGLAGSLALIWASLGVFGAITSAVNEAWGVEKRRSFLKHRLVSFLMLVAAGAVLIIGLVLVSAVQIARASWFGTMVFRFEWLQILQSFALRYAAIIFLIVSVGLVYYFIPNAKTRFRDVWIGAIVTGVLWRVAFDGFSWYVGSSISLTLVHGSVAAVVAFLLWVYVSAVILMYGVEFTAAHARLRSDQHRATPGVVARRSPQGRHRV
jgi:membrane protein